MPGRALALSYHFGALCLALQGGLFLFTVQRGHAGGVILLAGLLATGLACLVCGVVAARTPRQRPAGAIAWLLYLVLALQSVIVVVTMLGLFAATRDPAHWENDGLQRLTEAVARQQQALDALAPALDSLAADLAAEPYESTAPFAWAQAAAAAWPKHFAVSETYRVAVVLWQDDQRLAWDESAEPLPLPERLSGSRFTRGRDWWYLRRFVSGTTPLPGALVTEMQVRLAPAATVEPAGSAHVRNRSTGAGGDNPRTDQAVTLQRMFVDDRRPDLDRHWGDARAGMHLVRDVPLALGVQTDSRARLRITATLPPRQVLDGRADAGRLVLLLVAWSLSLLAWVGYRYGALTVVMVAWPLRAVLAGVDFFRWIQLASPQQRLAAFPEEWASLIDPAYFATPFMWGWFASCADALLTALLLAGTAVLAARLLATRFASDLVPGPDTRWWWRGMTLGILAGLVLLALRMVTIELAQNANPRLIGLQVPFRFISFWVLHAVLVAISTAAMVSLAAIGLRLRCGLPWSIRPVRAMFGAAVGALLVTMTAGLMSWTVIVAVAALAMLLWLLGPFVFGGRGLARQLAVVGLLLLAVAWNYGVLRDVYGRAGRTWLQRKAEQIVQPRDEWITFLLEDVLAEMVAADAASPELIDGSGEIGGGLGQQLWGNEAAYRLWQDSAVRDLGLPCLVEIADPDGRSISLFASGFLRDFGYEVAERSAWREVTPSLRSDPIVVQMERRRYPTGSEEVLRGEAGRVDGTGWIRVELPGRSRRIATLQARLAGWRSGPPHQGYRPRSEVDRPLLLLRGDDTGWLDAGTGSFPTAASAAVTDQLRAGTREWGTVEVAGDRYLCLWAALPAESQTTRGEGFLLGLQQPRLLATLLDLSRLILLDALVFLVLVGTLQLYRWLRSRPRRWQLGFQERFLVGYLVLGLFVLLMVGLFVDRLTREQIEQDAREQTRDGLAVALGQLQGLLAEQARTLAGSDYIAELLANRLAGERPLGPLATQQGMVYQGDGRLLLDETLSDLDDGEAAMLLAVARSAPLTVIATDGDLFLGLVIPIDLTDVLAEATPPQGDTGTATWLFGRAADGFFFYRQRLDEDLLAGLAGIVHGELVVRVQGEAVLASHPERVFAGETGLLGSPAVHEQLLQHPTSSYLHPAPPPRLAFTGCVALPAVSMGGSVPRLTRLPLPAVLAVEFPDRERDYAGQRERTILYLAGLATLILLTALLLVMVMTWRIFGPVRLLVAATQKLAGGDFAAPLPASGRDEVGRLAGAFDTMRGELAAARESLEARERFLATVLARVPVGVLVWDDERQIVALNPAGERILAEIYPETASVERADQLLAAFGALTGGPGGERELGPVGQRRTVRGRVAPLPLPGGRRETMLVFEDVTEFLANKRLALNAELAQQVAHEIKNPLTPIQLSVQLLHQAYVDGHADLDRIVDETVDRILQQVALLRSIAAEFSLLGRPGELECAALDLPLLVEQVASGYRGRRGGPTNGVEVRVASGNVPPVLAHRESLLKVLGNLMQNSIDARGEADRLAVDVTWDVRPGEVAILWQDNGPGLSAEVADRLFDPYFSTKSKGTGLGLAISRNLVEKMGGRISLTNRLDVTGAVAVVVLPRADV